MKTVFLIQFCYYDNGDNWMEWDDWMIQYINTARSVLKGIVLQDKYGYGYRIIKRIFTDEVVT